MTGLAKHQRLLSKADFNIVFNKSVKVSNSLFTILIHKSSKSHSRLGLIISKKVDKRAVQRNRIKRLCRETFRNFSFKINCDFVVLARPKISSKNNNELIFALNQLWQTAETKIGQIRKRL